MRARIYGFHCIACSVLTPLLQSCCSAMSTILFQGWCLEFSDGGLAVDSSDDRAKIWFSGCYKCQEYPRKSLFKFGQWRLTP